MPALTTRNPLLLAAAAGGLLMVFLFPSDGPGDRRGLAEPLMPAPWGVPAPDRRNRTGAAAAAPVPPTRPPQPVPSTDASAANGTPPRATEHSPAPDAIRSATRDRAAPTARAGTRHRPPTPDPRSPASVRAEADPTAMVSTSEGEETEAPSLTVPYSFFQPTIPATLPAALADAASGLDETGAAETARLTDTFLEQITGSSEDPRDPEYQRRWAAAQEENDARMRASLGGHAWLDRHREVHREVRPSPDSPPPPQP